MLATVCPKDPSVPERFGGRIPPKALSSRHKYVGGNKRGGRASAGPPRPSAAQQGTLPPGPAAPSSPRGTRRRPRGTHLPDGVRVLRRLWGGVRQLSAGAVRLRRRERRSISPPARHPARADPPTPPRRASLDATHPPHSPRRGRSAGPPHRARPPRASRRARTCGARAGALGRRKRRRGASGPAGASAARAGGGSRAPSLLLLLRPPSSAGSRGRSP